MREVVGGFQGLQGWIGDETVMMELVMNNFDANSPLDTVVEAIVSQYTSHTHLRLRSHRRSRHTHRSHRQTRQTCSVGNLFSSRTVETRT